MGDKQERTLGITYNTLILVDVLVSIKRFTLEFLKYIFVNETLVFSKRCTYSDQIFTNTTDLK